MAARSKYNNPYLNMVLSLGIRPPTDMPRTVVEGPFIWPATITDNATTAADLTAAAALQDRALWDIAGVSAGTDNAKVVVAIERIGLYIEESTETEAVLADLVQNLVMTHTPANGRTRRIPMHKYIMSFSASKSRATTDGLATTLQKGRTYHIGIAPLYVDLEHDEWTLAPHTAVNSAANVLVKMLTDGYAFSNTGWNSDEARCKPRLRPATRAMDQRRTRALFPESLLK